MSRVSAQIMRSEVPGRSTAPRDDHTLRERVAALGRDLGLEARTEVRVGRRIWGVERFIDVVLDVFAELARTGVCVVLSNCATPLVRRLYRGFRVDRVLAKRAINLRADRRGRVAKAIVRGSQEGRTAKEW